MAAKLYVPRSREAARTGLGVPSSSRQLLAAEQAAGWQGEALEQPPLLLGGGRRAVEWTSASRAAA